jgi:lipopolysaccharide/colanic/teichoic acid biosynthesis glycosyltransferase
VTAASAGPPPDREVRADPSIFEIPPQYRSRVGRARRAVKRVLDVAGSVFGLLILSPLLAAIAAAVWLDSGRPIFYGWQVVGRGGRPFTGYKFRTMVRDAERMQAQLADKNEMRGPVFKMRYDPRITRIGRFLRRFSLDELPQLWSVLTGDMSLVGPRPPLETEWARFKPWQRRKLAVTPGLTCLWQVSGRTDIADFDRWAALDIEYIERWSLRLDGWILWRTVWAVLAGRGAY